MLHEVKLGANPGLPSKITSAIVVQVALYRASSTEHAEQIAADYPALCRDLLRLAALRRAVRTADGLHAEALPARDPLVAEVASGVRRLRVDSEPRVVLFGFDADQRNGAMGGHRRAARPARVQVYAVGKHGGRTAAAFRCPADAGADSTLDAT